jgi:hypothetical protein
MLRSLSAFLKSNSDCAFCVWQVENSLFGLVYPATLVAGQIGFSLYEEEVAVVQPYAGWAMLVTQVIIKKIE